MRCFVLLLAALAFAGCPRRESRALDKSELDVTSVHDGYHLKRDECCTCMDVDQGPGRVAADARPLIETPRLAIDGRAIDAEGVVALEYAGIRPRVLSTPAARYPRSAPLHTYPVHVDVSFVADEGGHVVDAFVVSGERAFSEAALEDVRQWRFQPLADESGTPFRWRYRARVTFRPRPFDTTEPEQPPAVRTVDVDARAVGSDGIVDIGVAGVSPAVTYQPSPVMPPRMLSAGESRVRVTFVVGGEGWVLDARVAESCGIPALDAAAEESVRRWRYEPMKTRAGAPISWRGSVVLKL